MRRTATVATGAAIVALLAVTFRSELASPQSQAEPNPCEKALESYGRAAVAAISQGENPWDGAEQRAGIAYLSMGCRTGGLLAAMHAVSLARTEIAAERPAPVGNP